jgi:diadenosine tetraphosphatase ApaH/serine/threonine PP2A family protein phosphatase
MISIESYITGLRSNPIKIIPESQFLLMCESVKDIFINEPNLLKITSPLSIVGDLHGQFQDALTLLSKGGDPKTNKYLFLGDIVDRGFYSLELLQLLICYKLLYPTQVYLLRGNHETQLVANEQNYGFKDEFEFKYRTLSIWPNIFQLFRLFPIAALVDDKIFCAHGGISIGLTSLKQIDLIDRNSEPETANTTPNILTDLLWSDPDPNAKDEFVRNSRGAGCLFNLNAVKTFIKNNNLKLIVRSHKLAMEGIFYDFKEIAKTPEDGESFVTIWSAPNYTYKCGNKACILKVGETIAPEFFEHTLPPVSYARSIPQYFL